MKKKLSVIVIAIGILLSCASLFACAEEEDNKIIHTLRTVGTFSGYRVDYVWVEYLDADVNAVEVEYYVDDVYILTCPDPSYKYCVYTSEKDYMYLKAAYEAGLITHDDLLAIAKAEEPYDTLKHEHEHEEELYDDLNDEDLTELVVSQT